jgi:hypothetical protein
MLSFGPSPRPGRPSSSKGPWDCKGGHWGPSAALSKRGQPREPRDARTHVQNQHLSLLNCSRYCQNSPHINRVYASIVKPRTSRGGRWIPHLAVADGKLSSRKGRAKWGVQRRTAPQYRSERLQFDGSNCSAMLGLIAFAAAISASPVSVSPFFNSIQPRAYSASALLGLNLRTTPKSASAPP